MRDRSSEMPPPGAFHMAFERRAGAEGDDRHLMVMTHANHVLDVFHRLRETPRRRVPAGGM